MLWCRIVVWKLSIWPNASRTIDSIVTGRTGRQPTLRVVSNLLLVDIRNGDHIGSGAASRDMNTLHAVVVVDWHHTFVALLPGHELGNHGGVLGVYCRFVGVVASKWRAAVAIFTSSMVPQRRRLILRWAWDFGQLNLWLMVSVFLVLLLSDVAFSLILVLIIHAVYVNYSFVVLSTWASIDRVWTSLDLWLALIFVQEDLLLDGNTAARILQLIFA